MAMSGASKGWIVGRQRRAWVFIMSWFNEIARKCSWPALNPQLHRRGWLLNHWWSRVGTAPWQSHCPPPLYWIPLPQYRTIPCPAGAPRGAPCTKSVRMLPSHASAVPQNTKRTYLWAFSPITSGPHWFAPADCNNSALAALWTVIQ